MRRENDGIGKVAIASQRIVKARLAIRERHRSRFEGDLEALLNRVPEHLQDMADC